jgi:hypothetical protein
MRFALHVLAAPLLLLSTSCATIMTGSGREQPVRIDSEPRGADVFVNGHRRGTTPTSVSLIRTELHKVRIELPGYQPSERELRSGPNNWIWGNILLGGLIGLGVDYASGATAALKPREVNATLVPEPPAHEPTALPASLQTPGDQSITCPPN